MNKILIAVLASLLGFIGTQYYFVKKDYNQLELEYIYAQDLISEQKMCIDELEQKLLHTEQAQFDDLTTEQMFRLAAKTYGVDFSMLYAIARLETGNFTSGLYLENNNPGGMRTSDGWLSYGSKLEGIMEMARLLKRNYIDYGLTTPELIGPKYCPDSDTWATKVRALMSEVE